MPETPPHPPSPMDEPDQDALPLVAPCRELEFTAPLRWLRLGWQDLRRAPAASLSYGAFLVAFAYVVTYLLVTTGNHVMLFSLLTGFVIVGPVLAFSLYDISCQLDRGRRPTLGHCFLESRRHLGNELLFAVLLIIILLIWARAASMIHVFFPTDAAAGNPWMQYAAFLGVGSAVGALFAGFTFAVSAFALPMMMERKVDIVTAALTSINAVVRNKAAMALWGAIIVGGVVVGFATAFLGLALVMPVIGHATWHAYRDAIQADAFPAIREDESP